MLITRAVDLITELWIIVAAVFRTHVQLTFGKYVSFVALATKELPHQETVH